MIAFIMIWRFVFHLNLYVYVCTGMEEFNHAKMDNDRCELQDGCMSYTFTPPADKKDRLQSRLSNNDEKEKVRRLRCISLQKRQPFHRPPAPRPARHPAKRCKKDSSAQHSAATRNCSSPGGRRFFGTGKCWCGPGWMVPAQLFFCL